MVGETYNTADTHFSPDVASLASHHRVLDRSGGKSHGEGNRIGSYVQRSLASLSLATSVVGDEEHLCPGNLDNGDLVAVCIAARIPFGTDGREMESPMVVLAHHSHDHSSVHHGVRSTFTVWKKWIRLSSSTALRSISSPYLRP